MNTKLSTLLLSLSLVLFTSHSLADDGSCATKHHSASQTSQLADPMDGPMEMVADVNDYHAGMGMVYPKDTDLLMDAMVPDNIDALLTSQKIEIVSALNLNEEQQKQIQQLSKQMRDSNQARISQINQSAEQLHQLYDQPQRNPNAIDQSFKQIFDLKREMIGEVINTENRVYALLTEQQRNTLSGNNPAFSALH